MDAFPAEILSLIAEQLYYSDRPRDLASLTVVNSRLGAAASPWLFHRLRLRFDQAVELGNTLRERKRRGVDLSRAIRELTVLGDGEKGKTWSARVTDFKRLVNKLPAVKRITWKHSDHICNDLLTSLNGINNIQELDLTYRVDYPFLKSKPPPILYNNTKLVALRFELSYVRRMSWQSQPNFRHAILIAPALKTLEIAFVNSTRQLLFYDDEMLPSLETLILHSYGVGQGPVEMQIQKHLPLQGLRNLVLNYCRQHCLPIFFGSLIELSSSLGAPILRLTRFGMIKSQGISHDWQLLLATFLCSFKGLESLILEDVGVHLQDMIEVVDYHSRTLKVLKMHTFKHLTTAHSGLLERFSLLPCLNLQKLSLGMIPRCPEGFAALSHDDAKHDSCHAETVAQSNTSKAFHSFISLEELTFTTPLWSSTELIGKPLVDEHFVRQTAFQLRSPTLRALTVATTLEEIEESHPWEAFNRLCWEVKFSDVPETLEDIDRCCTIHEKYHEDRIRALRPMTDSLGESCNPPRTFAEFEQWKLDLEERYEEHLEDEKLHQESEELAAWQQVGEILAEAEERC